MQIAQAVYRIPSLLFGKRGDVEKVKMEDMELKFEDSQTKDPPKISAEEYSAKAKERWFAMLGMKQGDGR